MYDAHLVAWDKHQAWCLALVDDILIDIAIEEAPATLDLMVAYAIGG